MEKVLVAQSYLILCDPMDYITHQAPLSMGFLKQESWSVLPFPSPGDLPDPGIKLGSPALQADCLLSSLQGSLHTILYILGFPGSSAGKESTCNAGDPGLIPGSRRSLGEGNGNPLQSS